MSINFDVNAYAKRSGFARTLIILTIMGIPSLVVGYFAHKHGTNASAISQSTTVNLATNRAGTDQNTATYAIGGPRCSDVTFEETKNDWQLSLYSKPDADGYWCPSVFSSFSSPNMWHKIPVPLDFQSIKLVYEVKKRSESLQSAPFILSLGNPEGIFRFYIEEGSPQIIGFEHIDIEALDGKMIREPPQQLEDPILEGTEVTVTARATVREGNKVTYTFNVVYISKNTGEVEEDSFPYDIRVPTASPHEAETQFGVGTVKGTCIKPMRYIICR